MGMTKSQLFNASQNQIAGFAKAFAHPARVAIIQELVKRNSCVCGDLVEVLPLSQSTISQHLKELKQTGLLKGEVEGPRVCYCINQESWQSAETIFADLFDSFGDT